MFRFLSTTNALVLLALAATSAWAEHASLRGEFTSQGGGPASAPSGRGAAEYQRNQTVSKILNPQSLEGLSKMGSDSVKSIAESNGKSLQQVSQITSQSQDVGRDVITQLASAIPDVSSATGGSDQFSKLAKEQQDLTNTTTQIYQAQAQAALQIPQAQPTEPPAPRVTVRDRLAQMQPRGPFAGRNPVLMQNSNTRPLLNGAGLSRLPQAYNAPR